LFSHHCQQGLREQEKETNQKLVTSQPRSQEGREERPWERGFSAILCIKCNMSSIRPMFGQTLFAFLALTEWFA